MRSAQAGATPITSISPSVASGSKAVGDPPEARATRGQQEDDSDAVNKSGLLGFRWVESVAAALTPTARGSAIRR